MSLGEGITGGLRSSGSIPASPAGVRDSTRMSGAPAAGPHAEMANLLQRMKVAQRKSGAPDYDTRIEHLDKLGDGHAVLLVRGPVAPHRKPRHHDGERQRQLRQEERMRDDPRQVPFCERDTQRISEQSSEHRPEDRERPPEAAAPQQHA